MRIRLLHYNGTLLACDCLSSLSAELVLTGGIFRDHNHTSKQFQHPSHEQSPPHSEIQRDIFDGGPAAFISLMRAKEDEDEEKEEEEVVEEGEILGGLKREVL